MFYLRVSEAEGRLSLSATAHGRCACEGLTRVTTRQEQNGLTAAACTRWCAAEEARWLEEGKTLVRRGGGARAGGGVHDGAPRKRRAGWLRGTRW